MRPPLSFFCAGIPIAQPRARARSMGKFARVYNPPGPVDDWKTIVRTEAQKAWTDYPNQWLGPLCVNLTFYFPRPKGHFNSKGLLKPNAPTWHTSTPDVDNLFKSLGDAITNIGLWNDDRQVASTRIRKLYVTNGGAIQSTLPGCHIEIKEAGE